MQNVVLVFDGCPNVQTTLERLREAPEAAGKRDAVVRVLRIDDDPAAHREQFVGSPSVRVDGIDVEPAARVRTDFGLPCRVYAVGERLEGAPPSNGSSLLSGESAPRVRIPWRRPPVLVRAVARGVSASGVYARCRRERYCGLRSSLFAAISMASSMSLSTASFVVCAPVPDVRISIVVASMLQFQGSAERS